MSNSAIRVSNNTGELTGFTVKNFQYSSLGKIILNRLYSNRDIKMLITSSGGTTGTGKTQLSIILSKLIAKYVNEIFERNYEWNAHDHSFMDVYEYLTKYKNSKQGNILITDELEFMADRRRSMSHNNVHFSQAWQMLRYKNVITIGTAPSLYNLDKRVPENTDIWINVIFPGYANVYYMTMDDFTGQIIRKRIKQLGFNEVIRWKPIDDDPDYQILSEKKEAVGIPGIDEDEQEEMYDSDDVDQLKEEKEKELTEQYTINLLKMKDRDKIELTQEEIAELVNRSQQYVSKIKRNAKI